MRTIRAFWYRNTEMVFALLLFKGGMLLASFVNPVVRRECAYLRNYQVLCVLAALRETSVFLEIFHLRQSACPL